MKTLVFCKKILNVKTFWCFITVFPKMGNCLKTPNNDDISLLRGSEGQDGPDNLGPPPPYQVTYTNLQPL